MGWVNEKLGGRPGKALLADHFDKVLELLDLHTCPSLRGKYRATNHNINVVIPNYNGRIHDLSMQYNQRVALGFEEMTQKYAFLEWMDFVKSIIVAKLYIKFF